jgi:hypothetical protein
VKQHRSMKIFQTHRAKVKDFHMQCDCKESWSVTMVLYKHHLRT